MATRTSEHVVGDLGHLRMRLMFAEAGYATSDIGADYGEDFMVVCDDGGVIEPFRIYVQAKTTATTPAKWTVYVNTLTVRNWVLANDMTIVLRCHLPTGEMRYSIPEEEIEYWSLHDNVKTKIQIRCTNIFLEETPDSMMWKARLRHYDRIVRITAANEFEDQTWLGIPKYRLFVLELLMRLGLVVPPEQGYVSDKYFAKYHPLCMHQMLENNFDQDHASYAACLLIVMRRIAELSSEEIGMQSSFADKCALLLHDLMRERVQLDLRTSASDGGLAAT